ncbi:MAG: hypothetical protein DRM98_02655 [Thermoplasmata archaeon]|nr:MAG: hypothetical protein DRM98_02655 [Thermoplasmata archaeon]
MPGGDRTGPLGLGPRTGRAAGYCAGYSVPGYMNLIPGFGRGFGYGRGFGRGLWGRGRWFWRRGYYPYPAPYYRDIYPEPSREEEKTYLETLVKNLEEELKAVRERLQELSKEKKEEAP